MTNYIYSSFDKTPPYTSNSILINLGAPTHANQRLMAAFINELLESCEFDASPAVENFADKFVGESVGLTEGAAMMQLYENMIDELGAKISEQISKGDYSTTKPEIQARYHLAHLLHNVMTKQLLGFGLKPFGEAMNDRIRKALKAVDQLAIV